eukprot:UN03518
MDHSSIERTIYANGVIIPPYVAGHPKKHLNFIKIMLVLFVGLIFIGMLCWLFWRCLRRCCGCCCKDNTNTQGKFKTSSSSSSKLSKSNELNQKLL